MHTTDSHAATHDLVVETKGGRLRFDTTGAGGKPVHALYDPTEGHVVVFVDSEQRYFELDFAQPDRRGNTDSNTSSVRDSGSKKTVAGYECEVWKATDAEGKHSEVCIAQGIAFFDVNVLRAGGAALPESAKARKFRESKSFPLESIDYDGTGREIARTVVTRIEKKLIAETRFAIPAGYTKVDRAHAP